MISLPGTDQLILVLQGNGDSPGNESAVKIAKYLADHGADVMHKDLKGRTPLDLVIEPELKSYLEKYKIEE